MSADVICPKTSQYGDLTMYSKNNLPNNLEYCIQQIIEKEDFIKYKIKKQCVSSKNGNYLGVLFEIDIQGNIKNGNKELNIFVKCIKPDEETIKIICITDIYKVEMFAYKELSQIYEELQIKANVPLDKQYRMVKSYKESNEEAIIMENIAKKGFNTYYRMETASLNFLEMSVQELAKFHALSFVLREKRPDYFDEKIKSLKYPFLFGKDWPPFVQRMKNMTIDFVDEKYKERVEKFYNKIVQKYPQYYNDETIKMCLCHGDYRPNNILTKMNNGVEEEIITIDYQLIHYGSPVLDFLYFIFTSTDQELRKSHLSNLKELYYKSFSNFLNYFNLDANKVYPKEEFERVYKEKFDTGLMISLLYLAFLFVSEDAVPDMTGISFQIDARFKDRLRGVIEDYVELGVL